MTSEKKVGGWMSQTSLRMRNLTTPMFRKKYFILLIMILFYIFFVRGRREAKCLISLFEITELTPVAYKDVVFARLRTGEAVQICGRVEEG